ncbi:MAG TPA: zinc ribbon domain-containing protein [Fimbriimonadaceae bacterium]|nr:zinc ribbon domain-containing protein [Fimbriimonadaceae bacterium]
MPTYLYECSKCESTFEVEQRITENALTDCKCGAKGSVKRLIQPIAVMFKGEGFHINDYSAKPSTPDCTGDTSTCACASTESKTDA